MEGLQEETFKFALWHPSGSSGWVFPKQHLSQAEQHSKRGPSSPALRQTLVRVYRRTETFGKIHDWISFVCHCKQIEKQNIPIMVLVPAYAANTLLHFHLQNHLASSAVGSLPSFTAFLLRETSPWILQWHSRHSAGHWSHHIRLRHITSVDVTDRTWRLVSQQGTSPSTASYKDALPSKVK